MNVVILNQGTVDFNYSTIDALSRTTWTVNKPSNVKVYHYYGGFDYSNNFIDCYPRKVERNKVNQFGCQYVLDDIIVVGENDGTVNGNDPRASKFILALEHILNTNFDFLIRISNTTYVHIEKMLRYLDSCPRNNFYDGARNGTIINGKQIPFVAGWAAYFSRDVIELLVSNKEKYLQLDFERQSEDLTTGKLLFNELDYIKQQQFVKTFDFCFEEWDNSHFNKDDNIFCYKFRKEHPIKYINFHYYLVNYEKTIA